MFFLYFTLAFLIFFIVIYSRLNTIDRKLDALSARMSTAKTKQQVPMHSKAQQATEEIKSGQQLSPTVQRSATAHMPTQHKTTDKVVVSPEHKDDYAKFYGTSQTMKDAPTPPTPPAQAQKTTQHNDIGTRFITWLRHDWPMKIGGLLVILAVGWFVTYAAEQGWINEIGRVTLGYLFGIAMLLYGTMRARVVRLQGNLFIIIGVAAIFIATLAGVSFASVQISATAALFVMFITVGFVALLSLQQKNINLAGIMIFFGALIPFFFFDGLDIKSIFLYLLALTLGTLWIVARSGWKKLTLLMLVIVTAYAFAYIVDRRFAGESAATVQNMIVALIFALVFYATNVATIITSHVVKKVDAIIAVGVGFLYILFALLFVPTDIQVFFILAGILLFSMASYAIFRVKHSHAPTIIYGGVSFVLIIIATTIQFSGPVLTIAFIAEAAIFIVLMLYIMREKVTNAFRMLSVLLFMVPLLGVVASTLHLLQFIIYKSQPFFTHYEMINPFPDLLVLIVGCVSAFLITGATIYFTDTNDKQNVIYMRIFAYIGVAIAVVLTWIATHLFMADYDVASFVALFVYTVFGVGLYVLGSTVHYKAYRVLGAILFAIVLLRIFTVEFWAMEMPVRIITAFVLGGLFISTAFIARSHHDKD